MSRRCSLNDISAVAAALGESLAVQAWDYRPSLGDAPLLLVKNSTDTRWFRALLQSASALCLPRGRVVYPLQGAALLYFGRQVDAFVRLCTPFGAVLVPMKPGRTR